MANTDADFRCGVSLLQAALATEVAPLPSQVEAAALALLAASAGNPQQQAGIAALAVGCGAVAPTAMGRWLAKYGAVSLPHKLVTGEDQPCTKDGCAE